VYLSKLDKILSIRLKALLSWALECLLRFAYFVFDRLSKNDLVMEFCSDVFVQMSRARI